MRSLDGDEDRHTRICSFGSSLPLFCTFSPPLLNDIIASKLKVSTASNRIRCPEMKFALNHRSRFLHGHDCCETGKAFPQVRQEKYLRSDAIMASAAVRSLPRFVSDFPPEIDPDVSSETSQTEIPWLFQRSKQHLPHTLTVRSYPETLLQRLIFTQR